MLASLNSLLQDSDWNPQLISLDDHADCLNPSFWNDRDPPPSGVIWFLPRAGDAAAIESLAATGTPVVTYNRDFRFTQSDAVVAEVGDVVRTQFNHLWNLGKRRFAVLTVDRPSPSIRQYRTAAHELATTAGVSHRFTELTFTYTGIQRPSEAMIQRIDALMTGPDAPDAILCGDIFTFRGLEVWLAKNRHVRVPEDIAIATFDPIPYTNVRRLNQQIPVAMMDHSAMLAAALRLIEARIAGTSAEPQLLRIPAIMNRDLPAGAPVSTTHLLPSAEMMPTRLPHLCG